MPGKHPETAAGAASAVLSWKAWLSPSALGLLEAQQGGLPGLELCLRTCSGTSMVGDFSVTVTRHVQKSFRVDLGISVHQRGPWGIALGSCHPEPRRTRRRPEPLWSQASHPHSLAFSPQGTPGRKPRHQLRAEKSSEWRVPSWVHLSGVMCESCWHLPRLHFYAALNAGGLRGAASFMLSNSELTINDHQLILIRWAPSILHVACRLKQVHQPITVHGP